MDLFMPAERVLYDRAYYLSDEAERDYAFEVAEEHGIDVGEVLYSDELMKEVRDALDRDIDLYLDDEIAIFLPPNRPPRPVVCLDTGETFESAFQAGRAFGIAAGAVRTSASTGVERNGLHFYYGDEPKPGPEFFRERHSKTRPIVCLETGETFDGNPAAARPLHVSPATISQAVRYGTPVAGLHFYHGDEPKPAPEFFKPIKPERGKSPMQMAAAARAAAGNPGRPDGGQRPRRAV